MDERLRLRFGRLRGLRLGLGLVIVLGRRKSGGRRRLLLGAVLCTRHDRVRLHP
ncbi:MAG TPA: hypothetical protein VKR23_03980 [Gaiellaceae bacterium]|nr:hypothetical protein [Gaiellaceae bacterium]